MRRFMCSMNCVVVILAAVFIALSVGVVVAVTTVFATTAANDLARRLALNIAQGGQKRMHDFLDVGIAQAQGTRFGHESGAYPSVVNNQTRGERLDFFLSALGVDILKAKGDLLYSAAGFDDGLLYYCSLESERIITCNIVDPFNRTNCTSGSSSSSGGLPCHWQTNMVYENNTYRGKTALATNYDPRLRDWYRDVYQNSPPIITTQTFIVTAASESDVNKQYIRFANPLLSNNYGVPVVLVNGPLFNATGHRIGVSAVSMTLGGLSRFLQDLPSTSNTHIALLDNNGFLLGVNGVTRLLYDTYSLTEATSAVRSRYTTGSCENTTAQTSRVVCRHTISSFGNKVLRELAVRHMPFLLPTISISSTNANATTNATAPPYLPPEVPQLAVYEIFGEDHIVAVAAITASVRENLHWKLVTAVPARDYLQDIVAGRSLAIGVASVVAVAACIICALVLWRLMQPLWRIAEAMTEVATLRGPAVRRLGDALHTTHRNSRLREIRVIEEAFENLIQQLTIARSFLPSSLLAQLDDAQNAVKTTTTIESVSHRKSSSTLLALESHNSDLSRGDADALSIISHQAGGGGRGRRPNIKSFRGDGGGGSHHHHYHEDAHGMEDDNDDDLPSFNAKECDLAMNAASPVLGRSQLIRMRSFGPTPTGSECAVDDSIPNGPLSSNIIRNRMISVLAVNILGFGQQIMLPSASATMSSAGVAAGGGGGPQADSGGLSGQFLLSGPIYGALIEVIMAATTRHKGVLDSFQGDHFLMTFNAAIVCASHACAALSTFQAIREQATVPLSAGIATHSALVGNMGSATTRRFAHITSAIPQATTLERLVRYVSPPSPPARVDVVKGAVGGSAQPGACAAINVLMNRACAEDVLQAFTPDSLLFVDLLRLPGQTSPDLIAGCLNSRLAPLSPADKLLAVATAKAAAALAAQHQGQQKTTTTTTTSTSHRHQRETTASRREGRRRRTVVTIGRSDATHHDDAHNNTHNQEGHQGAEREEDDDLRHPDASSLDLSASSGSASCSMQIDAARTVVDGRDGGFSTTQHPAETGTSTCTSTDIDNDDGTAAQEQTILQPPSPVSFTDTPCSVSAAVAMAAAARSAESASVVSPPPAQQQWSPSSLPSRLVSSHHPHSHPGANCNENDEWTAAHDEHPCSIEESIKTNSSHPTNTTTASNITHNDQNNDHHHRGYGNNATTTAILVAPNNSDENGTGAAPPHTGPVRHTPQQEALAPRPRRSLFDVSVLAGSCPLVSPSPSPPTPEPSPASPCSSSPVNGTKEAARGLASLFPTVGPRQAGGHRTSSPPAAALPLQAPPLSVAEAIAALNNLFVSVLEDARRHRGQQTRQRRQRQRRSSSRQQQQQLQPETQTHTQGHRSRATSSAAASSSPTTSPPPPLSSSSLVLPSGGGSAGEVFLAQLDSICAALLLQPTPPPHQQHHAAAVPPSLPKQRPPQHHQPVAVSSASALALPATAPTRQESPAPALLPSTTAATAKKCDAVRCEKTLRPTDVCSVAAASAIASAFPFPVARTVENITRLLLVRLWRKWEEPQPQPQPQHEEPLPQPQLLGIEKGKEEKDENERDSDRKDDRQQQDEEQKASPLLSIVTPPTPTTSPEMRYYTNTNGQAIPVEGSGGLPTCRRRSVIMPIGPSVAAMLAHLYTKQHSNKESGNSLPPPRLQLVSMHNKNDGCCCCCCCCLSGGRCGGDRKQQRSTPSKNRSPSSSLSPSPPPPVRATSETQCGYGVGLVGECLANTTTTAAIDDAPLLSSTSLIGTATATVMDTRQAPTPPRPRPLLDDRDDDDDDDEDDPLHLGWYYHHCVAPLPPPREPKNAREEDSKSKHRPTATSSSSSKVVVGGHGSVSKNQWATAHSTSEPAGVTVTAWRRLVVPNNLPSIPEF